MPHTSARIAQGAHGPDAQSLNLDGQRAGVDVVHVYPWGHLFSRHQLSVSGSNQIIDV